MLKVVKHLRTQKNQYKNIFKSEVFDNRASKVINCNLQLQRRIFGYGYPLQLSQDYNFLEQIYTIFLFHPYEEVSSEALQMQFEFFGENDRYDQIYESLQFIDQKLNNASCSIYEKSTDNQTYKYYGFIHTLINSFSILTQKIMNQSNSLFWKPQLLQTTLKIMNSLENLNHQILENNLFDAFYTKFYSHFEGERFDEQVKKNIVISCNELHSQYLNKLELEQGQALFYTQKQYVKSEYIQIINYGLEKLNSQQTPWKQKIIYGLVCIALSSSLPGDSESIQKLITSFQLNCVNEHQYIRQLSRSALLKLLRQNKIQYFEKTVQYFEKQNFIKSIQYDDLIKWRFVPQFEYSNQHIQSPYFGFYSFYTYKQISIQQKQQVNQSIFPSKKLSIEILEKILSDVGIAIDSSINIQQSGRIDKSKSMMINIELYVYMVFNRNRKKNNLFKKIEIPYENYIRIISNYFFLNPQQYFDDTNELIFEWVKDHNNREKQIISGLYLTQLFLKSNQIFKTTEEQQMILQKINCAIIQSLNNVSIKIFQDWIYVLCYINYKREYRQIQDFFQNIISNMDSSNENKLYRINTIQRLVSKLNGHRSFEFNLKGILFQINIKILKYQNAKFIQYLILCKFLTFFHTFFVTLYNSIFYCKHSSSKLAIQKQILDEQPQGLKQIQEISNLFTQVISSCFLFPINLNILTKNGFLKNEQELEEKIQSGDIYQLHDQSKFYCFRNSMVSDCFKKLQDRLNDKSLNDEQQKNNIMLYSKMIQTFMYPQYINDVIFDYMEPIIAFNIYFEEELLPQSDQKSLIDLLNSNEVFIRYMRFSKSVLARMMKIITNGFLHKNWRVRSRSIKQFKFLIFMNVYQFDNIIDQLDPLYKNLIDENQNVSKSATQALSDILKILTDQELQEFIQRFLKVAESKNVDHKEKSIAIFVLMSVLLSYKNEIYEWTENILIIVLNNKKISKDSSQRIKEFASKFWKNKAINWNFNDIQLSQDVMQSLREIANPYNYFA